MDGEAASEPRSESAVLHRVLRSPGVMLLAVLTLLLGLLVNPWWVPTGDSEVFLVAGRNLANGGGLVYGNTRLAFVPPGWPMVLAGMMTLTDQVIWLKLFQVVCMGAFLWMSFRVLCRFTSPGKAALATGLAAICSPLYPLSVWLHSDPLFCVLMIAAMAVALQWSDGHWPGWTIGVVFVLLIAGLLIRWAGLPMSVVVAAACLGGGAAGAESSRERPSRLSRWLVAGLMLVVAFASFLTIRAML
ncbi:MAG: hypothetical protein AAGK78_03240, partial [Planctomycetota bacterium]